MVLLCLVGDGVVDVEGCSLSISSNLLLSATPSVSSSMFARRLMICASSGDLTELGNLVLERSDDLGLEGPCVGASLD